MALKKSDLYASLWESCNELRGGMDASQYKDYVLTLLFVKYVSDKYAGDPYGGVVVPEGSHFKDLVALKGTDTIGNLINTDVLAPLAAANKLPKFPDFNDPAKLGSGNEKVQRLTNLIGVFQNPALDFTSNRAADDDILGDAYEFLMRHFATESGKSKGQFYTPSEVSRTVAHLVGIGAAATTPQTTVYDPTCGSGSLLLKVADQASTPVTLYGQEKDLTTSGLARMNMILHDYPHAHIAQGNTLTTPAFTSGDALDTFDYIVANPPFSDKRWSTGLTTDKDKYQRFTLGTPPARQGDYAYLLHILRSLNLTGTAACILPHGVLFRGGAEGTIRRAIVRRGYLKAVVGLPPNLFYGTGIPACILVLSKLAAAERSHVYLVDAADGFIKDGAKNRLRERDIHRIVDACAQQHDLPGYARRVPISQIEANDYNLNLPRYIDRAASATREDAAGHLYGGIPQSDVEALAPYWDACPGLRESLFEALRPGYVRLVPDPSRIPVAVSAHPAFRSFRDDADQAFDHWYEWAEQRLSAFGQGDKPSLTLHQVSEHLLDHYTGRPLVSRYAAFQHLMDYAASTLSDDLYIVSSDGWNADPQPILNAKEKVVGWDSDLLPKRYLIAAFFADEQQAIDQLQAERETLIAEQAELEEEEGGDEGAFADLERVNKANVTARLRELRGQSDDESLAEAAALLRWTDLYTGAADLRKAVRTAEAELDDRVRDHYDTLTPDQVRALVVRDKWLATIGAAIRGETDRAARTLTTRVASLAERYATPLPDLEAQAEQSADRFRAHFDRMGVTA